MIFTSVTFILFFIIVFTAYWGLRLIPVNQARLQRIRLALILLASYFFYGSWDWRFLFLIWSTTLADFLLGRAIGNSKNDKARFRWVASSVALNLTFLGVFKYFNFFISSAQQLLSAVGIKTDPVLFHIILPIGISFYTFQSLSYTIDIYRRKMEPEPSLLNFAFFISFFPHTVAGPIVRAADFLPQTRKPHFLKEIDFDAALDLILKGFVKKVLVSDMIAGFSDQVFANPSQYGTLNIWLGVLTYAVQIYCDFSGYTDIAIGVAALLGYKLMRNFDLPYMAKGFSDFWRRWHISLSVWLRDYLYISLGGNRAGRWKTCRNLMLTMLLGGLWHGAAYTFIIWGGLHGIYLVLERVLRPLLAPRLKLVPAFIRSGALILITLMLVNVAWVFFRAQSVGQALLMINRMFSWHPDTEIKMPPYLGMLVALSYLLQFWGELIKRIPNRIVLFCDEFFAPLRMAALLILLILMSVSNEQPFIYFQF